MTALANYSFTRANVNPLPSPWTQDSGLNPLQVVSNNAVVVTPNTDSWMRYDKGSAWPADQYSEVIFGAIGNGDGGPTVRSNGVSSGYQANHNNGVDWEIYKNTAGSFASMVSAVLPATAGKKYKLLATGTAPVVLTLYEDNVQILTVNDASSPFTSGSPGIGLYGTPGVASWEGGDTSTATVDQEGFRFRNDDGSETGATWAAAQDANVTAPVDTNLRLRMLIDAATGDPASSAYRLQWSVAASGLWNDVQTNPLPGGTVTWGAIGTSANGTTTCSPAYPAAGAAGGYWYYCAVTGVSSTATTAPAITGGGWTAVLDFEGGSGAAFASDVGNRRVTWFKKNSISGTETGTITVTLAGTATNTLCATIHRFDVTPGYTITESASTGADTTAGTGFSATGSSTIPFATNDLLAILVASSTDTATQSAQAITATGITFGTRTNRESVAITAGNDHRHIVDTVPVTTGSGTPQAPTYAYTASASTSGPAGFMRMRAVAPAQPIAMALSANITASGDATTAQLTPPSGKTTSNFTAGRIVDDENGQDSTDIATSGYTEDEWCIKALSSEGATNGQQFDFRVVVGSTALNSYSVTPRWTLGTPSSASRMPIIPNRAARQAALMRF